MLDAHPTIFGFWVSQGPFFSGTIFPGTIFPGFILGAVPIGLKYYVQKKLCTRVIWQPPILTCCRFLQVAPVKQIGLLNLIPFVTKVFLFKVQEFSFKDLTQKLDLIFVFLLSFRYAILGCSYTRTTKTFVTKRMRLDKVNSLDRSNMKATHRK